MRLLARRQALDNRAAALMVALALDLVLGDVGGAWHPVALAGRVLEDAYRPWPGRHPATQLLGGTAALAAVAAVAALLSRTAERVAEGRLIRAVLLGVLLKQTFSIRGLLEAGFKVAESLECGRLDQARLHLGALVSRPTADLSPDLCASAAIESLAENLADSIAAPLLLHSLFGLPAAAGYRVVNTADAMFGYRGQTEWLGKSAARLDDMLNWIPSRLSALALTGASLVLGGRAEASSAWQRWRQEGGRTASPNAGQPMATMAGALERRLEKVGHYVLGERYGEPNASDIRTAIRLTGVAAGLLAAAALAWETRRSA